MKNKLGPHNFGCFNLNKRNAFPRDTVRFLKSLTPTAQKIFVTTLLLGKIDPGYKGDGTSYLPVRLLIVMLRKPPYLIIMVEGKL